MHGFRITPCAGGAALVAAVEAGGMVPPFQEKPFPRGDVAEAPPAG